MKKTQLDDKIILYKENEIFDFFNDKMNALELFYLEYDEYIKDIE